MKQKIFSETACLFHRGVVIGGLNTGYSLKNDPFTGYSLSKMSFPAYGIILPIMAYKGDKFAFPR